MITYYPLCRRSPRRCLYRRKIFLRKKNDNLLDTHQFEDALFEKIYCREMSIDIQSIQKIILVINNLPSLYRNIHSRSNTGIYIIEGPEISLHREACCLNVYLRCGCTEYFDFRLETKGVFPVDTKYRFDLYSNLKEEFISICTSDTNLCEASIEVTKLLTSPKKFIRDLKFLIQVEVELPKYMIKNC